MMRHLRQRGSALIGAIWTLAVLSILIASYAMDAHLQTRINLYLKERMAVDHLTDAGLAIAEVIMTDYENVSVITEDNESELEEKLEDDRWYLEKMSLKNNEECDTKDVPVDALNPDGGTVRVKIKPIEAKWNINNLYAGGDANYAKVWMGILAIAGVPEDYWDGIIESWCDWRDSDETKTGDDGAESEYYQQCYEDFKDNEERPDTREYQIGHYYKARCRNGEIADLDELKCLKGFNVFEDEPINADAFLDGGVINPDAREDERITIPAPGLRPYFTVFGSGKINANIAPANVLATVPGFYQGEDPDDVDPDDVTNAVELAKTAVKMREPSASGLKSSGTSLSDKTGSYESFQDMKERVNDGDTESATVGNCYLQQDAEQYVSFAPDKFFEVTVTGSSFGISHSVKATALIQDGKVRYIRWEEDP